MRTGKFKQYWFSEPRKRRVIAVSRGASLGARGAAKPALASEAQLKSGKMALRTGGGFDALHQWIPDPLRPGDRPVRFPGWVAHGCVDKQLGLMDLHQVQEPQVDSQLALLRGARQCGAVPPGRVLPAGSGNGSSPRLGSGLDGTALPPRIEGRCSIGKCVRAAAPAALRARDAGCWRGLRGSVKRGPARSDRRTPAPDAWLPARAGQASPPVVRDRAGDRDVEPAGHGAGRSPPAGSLALFDR